MADAYNIMCLHGTTFLATIAFKIKYANKINQGSHFKLQKKEKK
jgi:hypothetical protein